MLVVLHLFALFLLVLLGFYVFVADPRRRSHQTFAIFIAFLALWTVKDQIFWNFYEAEFGAGWWVAVSFITALLMQYALAIFAWVFPENSRTPRVKAAVLFAPGLVLIPAALFGLLWRHVEMDNGHFSIELAPLAYVFVAYIYFVFFYGTSVLFKKYRQFRGTQMGQQVGAVLWAVLITGLLKTAANIVLPYFDQYWLLPYSSIFVLPGVVIYAYAISNFSLFSLQSALDQFRLFPLTYKTALSIASVAVISFALFQIPIAWWSFRNGMDAEAWRKYLVFSVISALVPNLILLLLVVRSISRPLQRITVAAVDVTNGKYGTEVDLRKSNDEIGLLANSFNEMSRKMAEDIEKLGAMNEQLMRADRLAAMGTLAAGVAHEVNNPLASISSMIQMMREEHGGDSEAVEQLEMISSQIERIKNVTQGLTKFARTRPAARSRIDVRDVVDSAIRLAEYDGDFRGLDTRITLADGLPQIFADPDQLQQVILNLLLNAKDAMPNGGSISVNGIADQRSVMLTITDTGVGMDDAAIGNAFDPFFTTKPPGKGTGLGLAVCYGIVTSHGGTIEIGRNADGGTEVTITLPRYDAD